jgi:glutamate--cysteine ligase
MPSIEHCSAINGRSITVPFYCSVDLQHGSKPAPVDANLFPVGFNNLNPEFMPLCVQAILAAVEKICAAARDMLLILESHTRNIFYLQSVATLLAIKRHTESIFVSVRCYRR